jgi:AraC-like DNA-binding protein
MVLMATFRSKLSVSKNVRTDAFPPGGRLQFQRYLSQSGKSVSAANDRHYIALILSLADIALGCGVSSQSYVTDIFRQQLGITPQQYRRSGSHKS